MLVFLCVCVCVCVFVCMCACTTCANSASAPQVDELRSKMERVGKEKLAPYKEMVEQIKSVRPGTKRRYGLAMRRKGMHRI